MTRHGPGSIPGVGNIFFAVVRDVCILGWGGAFDIALEVMFFLVVESHNANLNSLLQERVERSKDIPNSRSPGADLDVIIF